ncbi:hypothetical protein EG68_10494 [Paragonimus skrjabini miyazakii]|uniref:Apple domain-containing protein n=1 Tax=Paragonimus skrjabini miyazakii TaxID=59628 RepID=A0A8S9YGB6_9TREM|nr:hypothetical protein EG68_10494 [Paragonimus skrjabini miyazakii]
MKFSISVNILFSVHAVLANISAPGLYTCPPSTLDVQDGVCFILFDKSVNYCEAHQVCEKEGHSRGLRLFMVGREANKVKGIFNSPRVIPTGIHTLMNPGVYGLYGWQVNEPGYISKMLHANDFLWGSHLHAGVGEQVAVVVGTRLIAVSQSMPVTAVVCQLSTVPYPNKSGISQFYETHSDSLTNNFMGSSKSRGCLRQTTALSTLACGLKCRMLDECVSFYFNQNTNDCHLSMYVDSRLPKSLKDSPGTWARYARKS